MTTEIFELQTVDENGVPVSPRIKDAAAMRTIFDDYVAGDQEASVRRAKVTGLVNGNAPYTDKEMRDSGQAYRYNFNDRTAESIIDNAGNALFNLVFDNASLAEFSFEPGAITDPTVEKDLAAKLAIAYTATLVSEERIFEGLQRAIRDRNVHGFGSLLWDRNDDWRYRGIDRSRIFIGPNASTNIVEDFDEPFFITDTMRIHEINWLIEHESAATALGWEVPVLKKALARYFYTGSRRYDFGGDLMMQWEALEKRIRSGDLSYVSKQYASFSIVHGYNTEPSGKATHSIIPFDESGEGCEYLFYSFEQYASPAEVFCPLAYDYGDGTLKSVKGLGPRIFASCTVAMRKLNSLLDASDLGGSLLIKDLGGGDAMNLSFQRMGPVTLYSKDLEIQQSAFNPPLEPQMMSRNTVLSVLNENAGIFRPGDGGNAADQTAVKTAEQIRAEQAKESRLEKDRLFFFYLQMDRIHSNLFSRLRDPKLRSRAWETAKRGMELFHNMCLSLGLTDEFFTEYGDKIIIKATRSVGAGSTTAKLNALLQIKANTWNSMDEIARKDLDREIALCAAGPANIERFHPLINRDQIPSNEMSIAQLEVNDFEEGVGCLVGADQNHAAHIRVPISALARKAQQYVQAPLDVDVVKFINLITYAVPHIQEHMQRLSLDPTREAQLEEFSQQMEQLMPVLQQAMQQYQQVLKQQEHDRQMQQQELERLAQENATLRSDASIKQRESEALIAIEQQKTDSLNASRDAKTQKSIEVMLAKAQASLAIQAQNAQADLTKKYAELEAEMQKTQITLQKMRSEQNGQQ